MELRVLIVDDEKAILDIYESVLKDHCKSIIKASNGVEAINLLEKEHVNLAIIDIKMPSMDGYELIRLIREKHPEILMTVNTAVPLGEDKIDELLGKGVSGFLFKPTSAQELLNHVKGVGAMYFKES